MRKWERFLRKISQKICKQIHANKFADRAVLRHQNLWPKFWWKYLSKCSVIQRLSQALVPEFRSCTKDLWTGPIPLFSLTEPVGNCDAIRVCEEEKRGDSRSGNNGGNEKSYAEYSAFRRLFAFQKLLATATRTGNKLHRTKPVSAFAKRNKRA